MNNKFSVVLLLLAWCCLIDSVQSSFLDQLMGKKEVDESHGRLLGKRNKCLATGKDECAKYGGRCTTAYKCRKKYGDKAIFKEEFCNWKHPLTSLYEQDPKYICGCCIKAEKPDLSEAKEMYEEIVGAASLEDHTGHEGDRIVFRFVNTDPVLDETKDRNLVNTDPVLKATIFNMLLNTDSKLISTLYDNDKEDHYEMVGFNTYSNAENGFECEDDKDIIRCHGIIDGHVHSESIDELFGYEDATQNDKKGGDKVFTSQFVAASIEVVFELGHEAFDGVTPLETQDDEVEFIRLVISVNPSKKQHYAGLKQWTRTVVDDDVKKGDVAKIDKSSPLIASIQSTITVIDPEVLYPGTIIQLFEAKQHLCVQPVRIRNRSCKYKIFGFCFFPTYTYSGDGLAFGRPGADEEWGKVDITFGWQPWITVIDNDNKYKSLTTSEMSSLRSEVSVSNCIEVFFVPKFSPSDTYGGGACWSSGTANAKIISSDEQVAAGIDRTHLAHELGHALGLMHPGTSDPAYPDGSTGTLMCPSGWLRDNPDRNSRDNGNNVVNPLLINYFGSLTIDNHDCNSSPDCGTCSAHMR